MKRTLLIAMGLLLFSSLQAQEYVPFVEEGKAWNFVYTALDGYWKPKYSIHYSYVLEGDTIIGGESWKKLYYEADRTYTEELPVKELYGAMREEGGKVFFYSKSQDMSGILFDFTLSIGDKSPTDDVADDLYSPFFLPNGELQEREPINFESGLNTTIYRFKYEDVFWERTNENIWVEGVGGVWGFYPNLEPQTSGGGFGWRESYLSCTLNGEVLVTGEEMDRLLNPTGIDQLSTCGISDQTRVFDLQGRRVTDAAQKGVYIYKGKKVIK